MISAGTILRRQVNISIVCCVEGYRRRTPVKPSTPISTSNSSDVYVKSATRQVTAKKTYYLDWKRKLKFNEGDKRTLVAERE
jgi:hypothetical protein